MKATRNKKTIVKTGAQPLLQQLAAMPEKFAGGQFRKQYAALCFRRQPGDESVEVLLITSRGTGRWVIPKGWPMKKKKPYEAAEIEAWEEAGVRGAARKKPVGRYTYLKWLENGDVAPCVVEVFQIEVEGLAENFKERGQRQIAWVSTEEAARRVREVELKSLLVHFRPKFKG